MRVLPLGADSLGARTMVTIVQTCDLTILIDPSVSLAPYRDGHRPHALELATAWRIRKAIMEVTPYVDVIIQTHYHGDHVSLPYSRHGEFTSRKTAEKIYFGPLILAKNPDKKTLYYNQRKRAKWLWSQEEKIKIETADDRRFTFGNTSILFSKPLPHGSKSTRMGCVLSVLFQEKDDSFIFTSDVSGPLTDEATDFIVDAKPKTVILDGPSLYHSTEDELVVAKENTAKINEITETLVVDHHLSRDPECLSYLELFSNAMTSAEYIGLHPQFLEMRRKELYKQEEKFNGGKRIKETILRELARKNPLNSWLEGIEKQLKQEIRKD